MIVYSKRSRQSFGQMPLLRRDGGPGVKIIDQGFAKLRTYIDRPWYVPMVSCLAALDLFVMFVPTDGLLLTTYFGKTKRLWGPVLWVGMGSALGAVLLAGIVELDIHFITDRMFASVFHTDAWNSTELFLHDYGIWALAVSSVSPMPQQPVVIIASLAGMPLTHIFAAFFIGRVLKYGFYAYCTRYLPQLVSRVMSRDHLAGTPLPSPVEVAPTLSDPVPTESTRAQTPGPSK